jgi:putative PEP-CTERM system histidine kinase
VNKYEYRDEWLTFSSLLRGELNEVGVVKALEEVLSRSLYTKNILIWLGDDKRGYRLAHEAESAGSSYAAIPAADPLVSRIGSQQYLYLANPQNDKTTRELIREKRDFFTSSDIVLMTKLTIGDQCVGLIGLGPEFTGGLYGHDDFDLLAALGTQAASALLAVRTAEELAHAREKGAWDTLSAFVLHDVKNAATTLSLVKANAPEHIHDPAFQKDMLESVDDALKRMSKVQTRLRTLKGEISPVPQELELCRFVRDSCSQLGKGLPGLKIEVDCRAPLSVRTDPEMLFTIIENLLLNTREACRAKAEAAITIAAADPGKLKIEFTDNGPGISQDLLPELLFEPFRTGKPKGSGIGLWQVRQLTRILGGTLAAGNIDGGGARFTIHLPVKSARAPE